METFFPEKYLSYSGNAEETVLLRYDVVCVCVCVCLCVCVVPDVSDNRRVLISNLQATQEVTFHFFSSLSQHTSNLIFALCLVPNSEAAVHDEASFTSWPSVH
jgi:hypothetical protein